MALALRRSLRCCALVVAASILASSAIAAAPGEAVVEARLLAPCCYLQTLDVHESPLATELRAEVHARLVAGETPEAIEDDFAVRYGERVRAFAKGKDPRNGMTLFVAAAVGACGVMLAMALRRWRRTKPRRTVATTTRDALDDRIDAELADLDG